MTRLESRGRDPESGRRRWRLHLLDVEAAILRGLPEQLRALLANPDSNRAIIDRLFPASYADPAEEREHRKLLGRGLLDERRELLDAVDAALGRARAAEPDEVPDDPLPPAAASDDEDDLDDPDDDAPPDRPGIVLELDGPGLDLWLRFVNDVRLVIATDLGVDGSEPEQPPADPKRALLEYLGGLESILVEAARQEF